MSRKSKIIISIVFILVITISLAGFTYGYFQLNINGTVPTKSVSASTKSLKLNFNDNTSDIVITNKIVPDNSNNLGTKTFSVTNNSNTTDNVDYLVVIDNVIVRKVDSSYTTTFVNKLDFRYTLTCTTSNSSYPCYGAYEQVFPINGGMLVSNRIGKGVTHTYTLTIKYLDTFEDQSADMDKTYSARVNVQDARLNNFGTTTLAYNILNNALNGNNGTTFTGTPATKPAEAISSSTEKELLIAPDEYGKSYYFRGNVENNYVNFSNKCWRIVRIQGDGSIKLILEDKDYECNSSSYTGNWRVNNTAYVFGYSAGTNSSGNTYNMANLISGSMYSAHKNFVNSLLTSKLKSEQYCYDDLAFKTSSGGITNKIMSDEKEGYYNSNTGFYYDSYVRLYGQSTKSPTFYCLGTKLSSQYGGLITADEAAFAGGRLETSNQNYYLINSWQKNTSNGSNFFWTGSLNYFQTSNRSDYAIFVHYLGNLNGHYVNTTYGYTSVRPTVVLKSNTTISSGNGTKSSPYVIS